MKNQSWNFQIHCLKLTAQQKPVKTGAESQKESNHLQAAPPSIFLQFSMNEDVSPLIKIGDFFQLAIS